MAREQAGVFRTQVGELAFVLGLMAIEISRRGFELLVKFGAFSRGGVQRFLQISDLFARFGKGRAFGFFQLLTLRGEAPGLLFRVGLGGFEFGEKFVPIRPKTVAIGRDFFQLLPQIGDCGVVGFGARLRGGELFSPFGESLSRLIEVFEDRDFFLLDGRRLFGEFLYRALLLGGGFCVDRGRLFQLLCSGIAHHRQLLDLCLRCRGGCVALAEECLDAIAIFRDVLLEPGHRTGFPLRAFRSLGAGCGFDRFDGRRGFRADLFNLLNSLIALGDSLAILLGQRVDALLQFLLRAGKFGFAFAGRGVGVALRFRAHRLDQRGRLLAGPLRCGEGTLGLDPCLAFAGQFLRGRALAAFKRGDALLKFLEMPLVFLLRKTHFDDGLLLGGEARGGLCQLFGEFRFVLEQRIPFLRDRGEFVAAFLFVGIEFGGQRLDLL